MYVYIYLLRAPDTAVSAYGIDNLHNADAYDRMYVHMYVCAYVYIYIYICMYVCIYVCMYVYMYLWRAPDTAESAYGIGNHRNEDAYDRLVSRKSSWLTPLCMYVCMYVCMYIYVCVFMYVWYRQSPQ